MNKRQNTTTHLFDMKQNINDNFDPYNYKFEGMTDEEFNACFDDEDEAKMYSDLYELISGIEKGFFEMLDVIDTYEGKKGANEKTKKHRKEITAILKRVENLPF